MDYVLPLRWADDAGVAELTAYLRRISRSVRVIVVDGSPDALFERHARLWRGLVVHARPDPGHRCANGKVAGVRTGLDLATAEHVVIADDDVRYDEAGLRRMAALLRGADLVRPQNHFDPLPWHARWDTARSLLNRSLGADYPGTLGVRRSFFLAMGGYDGDVLFENLELIRTVRAHGGHEAHAPGLYVRRLPPEAGRFWSQRVRQAYDDLAQPLRLATFLALLPALAAAVTRLCRVPAPAVTGARRRGTNTGTAGARGRGAARAAGVLPVALPVALSVALAEAGRRRAGGRRVFPASTVLFAPVWVLERAACSWLALAARAAGGVPYAGRRLRVAAHSVRTLRRRARRARRVTAGRQGAGSGSPEARKPAALCEPSQNGLAEERPHRHSATVARPGSIGRPC